MLFKRKGAKDEVKPRGASASPASGNGAGAETPNPPVSRHEPGSTAARRDVASLFSNTTPIPGAGDGLSRNKTARRSRDGQIDWDAAARDEIASLLGDEPGGVEETDKKSDLLRIKQALAERKAREASAPPAPAADADMRPRTSERLRPMRRKPADPDANAGEKDKRLNWLVDFIADDEDDKPSETPPPAKPADEKPRWRSVDPFADTPADAQRPPLVSPNAGFAPEDLELVLGDGDVPGSAMPFDPTAIVGDGFNDDADPFGGPKQRPPAAWSDMPVPDAPVEPPTPVVPPAPPAPASRPAPEPPRAKTPAPPPPPPARPAERASAPQATNTPQVPDRRGPLDLEAIRTKDRVVASLLGKQLVTMSQVLEAQKRKEREGSKETLWRILAEIGDVDTEAIFAEAARIYAFPSADIEGKLDPKFARSVMETLSEENRDRLLNLRLVPFECETEHASGAVKLVFITHDPMRTEVRQVMKELKLDRFDLYYAPQSAVENLIAEAFPRRNVFLERVRDEEMAFDLGMTYEEGTELIDEDALEAEISRSSLINLFEATLVEAVRQGASDIHIYPNASKRVEIHFRIDGRLSLWHTENKVHPEALLAVIKDNAMNVDRFERDAAQDGYIQRWIDDVLIRFRVSVLPIANARQELRSESIVIRVLDDRKVIRDLRKLGLLDNAMQRFEQAISQPHGMVILTGPTGSGKSTSLVAALHHVITGEVNVLTVEDPVEYIIPGVRQIKLNHKLELEDALRAILRHDPDIVMVGEMRDRKTAELAIKLANTGHLTFSTLHTNDAPSAVSRLYKMGIEPFLIAYAINLVVAQRLIRMLCPVCKTVDSDPDPVMLDKLGFTEEEINSLTFYLPGNDSHCSNCKGVGYKGRRAISEALFFSRAIRHLIVESDTAIDEGAVKDLAVKEGMLTLRDSAREIVKMGQTSVREMIRVVTTDG
ncbi:MAG: GspE/PulE family protein [Rhodothermales bacterium]